MPQGTNGLIVLHQEYKRADATSGGRFATGLKGFHPQNEGVNFRQAYRWGLRGQYLSFVPVRNLASFKEIMIYHYAPTLFMQMQGSD